MRARLGADGSGGVRVALVGLGRMGRAHMEALRSTPRLRLVAVADPSGEARAYAEEHGLVAFASLDQLIAAGGFESVVVASPTESHLAVVRQLVGGGLPVLCEKPCGLTAREARDAGRIAVKAGVPLQIGYWKRFVPPLATLRQRIVRGELGEISLVSCFQWDERPPAAAFRVRSGGPLIDMAVHELDLMRWLTGQEIGPAAGFASPIAFDPPVEADPESVALVVRLTGGALGMVSVGRRFTMGDAHRVEVIGTHGTEESRFVWPPNEVETFRAALVAQAESFADAVEGAPMVGARASDAAAALEAAERAARELQNG